MKLFADENIPGPVVLTLREADFDVQAVGPLDAGSSDTDVLRRAGISVRILLTADRDFGALVYALGEEAPVGVLYIRLGGLRLPSVAARIAEVLNDTEVHLAGYFTVVEPGRTRPLPRA